MSEKNIVEMVNVNGELGVNRDKWMMEKTRFSPRTVTQTFRQMDSMVIV